VNAPRILIAGIGNIFLGDDAFGVEVAKQLAAKGLPPRIEVVDFGINGLDLTYALMDGYETVILIDAIPRGQTPGTLYTIAPDTEDAHADDAVDADILLEAHSLSPAKVLRLVQRMGGRIDRLLLVGCEPSPLDTEEMREGLSAAVAAAVPAAVTLVLELIQTICASNGNLGRWGIPDAKTPRFPQDEIEAKTVLNC
jgi:hydrogenase maturation protease